jgi:hypothetical protein
MSSFDSRKALTVTKVALRLRLSLLLGMLLRYSASHGCDAIAFTSRHKLQALGTEAR